VFPQMAYVLFRKLAERSQDCGCTDFHIESEELSGLRVLDVY